MYAVCSFLLTYEGVQSPDLVWVFSSTWGVMVSSLVG